MNAQNEIVKEKLQDMISKGCNPQDTAGYKAQKKLHDDMTQLLGEIAAKNRCFWFFFYWVLKTKVLQVGFKTFNCKRYCLLTEVEHI